MTHKIVIVGDAYGEEDELADKPFLGAAGHLLDELLTAVGLSKEDCLITNVFLARPYKGDIKNFFLKRPAFKKLGKPSPFPAYGAYGFCQPELEHHVDALYKTIKEAKPNLIIALGSTALWALTGEHGIASYRGTILKSYTGHKTIPTYHPGAVLRDFSLRAAVFADLAKANKEAAFPEIKVKEKKIWIAEQVKDLDLFYNLFIKKSDAFAFDIETNFHRREITCISIAPTPNVSLVIPFALKDGTSYWTNEDDEVACLLWLYKLFRDASKKKIAQNALYDLFYLTDYGIFPLGPVEDTMLMHHTLQPELPKGLGYLASIYCNFPAWKMFRKTVQKDINKADD